VRELPDAQRYVVTCGTNVLAPFAAADLAALTGKPVHTLEGGTQAWIRAGLPTESGDARLASPRFDRYRRPYEGTDAAREAMQAYLEWEYGLVAQLERDGTHGFFVI
jgi:3-mercaptopyruvate sulfurtransferase SseA